MTKKLEELLDLPSSKEVIKEENDKALAERKAKEREEKKKQKQIVSDLEKFDKIAASLPHVKGLDKQADDELNDIASKALDSYEDLMDLGMNVEGRYAGRIFEVASTMLKTGLDAKVAKIEKKLKMVDLQLKKEKIDGDNAARARGTGDGQIINGDGVVVTDRNTLLKQLRGETDK